MAHAELRDGFDMGVFDENELLGSTLTNKDSTFLGFSWGAGLYSLTISGQFFTYGGPNLTLLTGGVVNSVTLTSRDGQVLVTNAQADGAVLGAAFTQSDPRISEAALFNSDDDIRVVDSGLATPGDHTYLAYGYGGNDLIQGGGGLSTLFGMTGNDTIQGASAATGYLRGDEGNDSVSGGAGFDDINGNMGNDTAHGNLGDDWVVGGKDNDVLFGDAGGDIVYGNLGEDSCDGGTGADLIRGGQGDDTVSGGADADWLSGDRGDDTLSGGAGADIFHTFGDAGIDRVLDFSVADGDRVQLDPGTQWTAAQVGADTVISMTGGAQMILVGVQMSTLPTGWIFGA